MYVNKGISRRGLLLSGATIGLFPIAATAAQHPEVWQKGQSPLLTANLPWEAKSVMEPSVVRGGDGVWRMVYCGGWNNARLGYARCDGDPTIPSNWFKRGDPIIGPPTGGWSGNFWANPGHHCLFRDERDGKWYCFFTTTGIVGCNIWVATTDDPDASPWVVHSIPVMTTGAEDAVMGNSCIWVENGVWYNLYDACSAPHIGVAWKTYLARAPSAFGPWTKDTRDVNTSLLVGSGATGGWSIQKVNGKYNIWGINAPAGQTPSYIYHHYSYEAMNWGVMNGGAPVLTISDEDADQIADPDVHRFGNKSLMFYDVVNNPKETTSIWVASINRTLEEICN